MYTNEQMYGLLTKPDPEKISRYDLINKPEPDELYHYGIKGMRWGVRRYQNPDGSLTQEGKRRAAKENKKAYKKANKHPEKLAKYYDKLYRSYFFFTFWYFSVDIVIIPLSAQARQLEQRRWRQLQCPESLRRRVCCS